MGPSATRLLAELDADVVKLEPPEGDSLRRVGPWRNPGMGPLFLQANAGKRGVVLDLKTEEGRAAALALAGLADVFVSNIRPAALSRLGLDAATMRAAHPRLIHCLAVGYGGDGPNAGQPVYDDLMQAASGIAGLFAAVDGAPRYAPVNLCDRVVGLHLAAAILAALVHRGPTGDGQAIEVPMFETMAGFVLADHLGGAAFVPPLGPMGYNRLLSRARGPYPTADGYLAVVVYTDRHWRDFLGAIDRPELLAEDPRFASQASRTLHAETVGRFLAETLAARPSADWLALFRRLDIPACPVNSLETLREDPHLAAVGFFGAATHPTEGTLTTTRFPVRFSATPAAPAAPAPPLGADTGSFLG
jgi:crotonobetainyl-CoA:carnitine CoA-transferase CaiB-like acyl-CoA transferase